MATKYDEFGNPIATVANRGNKADTNVTPPSASTDLTNPAHKQLHYNICNPYNMHEYYTMKLQAWVMPQIMSDLNGALNSDENTANILRDGIVSIVADEMVEIGGQIFDTIKDGINYYKEKGFSDLSGVLIAGANEQIQKFMSQLSTYTDGAEPSKKKYECEFILPVPQNLTDTLRHQYDQDTFTPLEAVRNLGGYLSRKIVSGEGINRAKDALIDFNIKQAKRNNFSFDNNLINIYKQTDQREFIFNITLIPQSYKHYVEIVKAYSKLKILMTGDKALANMGMFQKYCFTITFQNKYFEQYMMLDDKIDLNLETLEIDVSGNPYTTFSASSTSQGDGVPKLIQIIMTFRERRPLRNDVNLDNLIGAKKDETNDTKTK